jgi:sulfite dehydrogenase (cytochrome) subunit B
MRAYHRVIALLLLAAPVAAQADEGALRLADAPEHALVLARCSACHSVDYIQMNAPFLQRPQWEAEVKKMVKAYGAPVSDTDAATIVEYLVQHYGAATAAP